MLIPNAYPQNFYERTQKKAGNSSYLYRLGSGRLRVWMEWRLLIYIYFWTFWILCHMNVLLIYKTTIFILNMWKLRQIEASVPSPLFAPVVWQMPSVTTHPLLVLISQPLHLSLLKPPCWFWKSVCLPENASELLLF